MKYIVILTLTLLGYGSTKAQAPIFSYGEHSMEEIRKFSKSNTDLAYSWNDELVSYVQDGLSANNKSVTVTPKFIMDHTTIEERQIKKFRNSSRTGSKVNIDKHLSYDFEGMVGIFSYEEIEIIIFKANCLNLLQVVYTFPPPAPKPDPIIPPTPVIPPKKDTVIVQRLVKMCTMQVSIVVDRYYDEYGRLINTVDRPYSPDNPDNCTIQFVDPTYVDHYAQPSPKSNVDVTLNFDLEFYQSIGIRGRNLRQCARQYRQRCQERPNYADDCRRQYERSCQQRPTDIHRPRRRIEDRYQPGGLNPGETPREDPREAGPGVNPPRRSGSEPISPNRNRNRDAQYAGINNRRQENTGQRIVTNNRRTTNFSNQQQVQQFRQTNQFMRRRRG